MRFWISYIIESIGNTVFIGKRIYNGGKMLSQKVVEVIKDKKKK